MDIGFIGLGIMGKPMAINLLAAGYRLFAYDINEAAVADVEKAGAVACTSIASVTSECDTIITMLPNSPHVLDVVLGEGGILHTAAPGTLLIDMSSIAPEASRRMEESLRVKNINMLDAPVSGGEPKAVDGTLAIMVGGNQRDFECAKPIFDVLGSSAVLVGPIGSGNICKLTNQIIVAINIAAVCEGLMLAKRSGADVDQVFQAIKGGLAGSTVMNAKVPMILERNFKPGFRIELHIKDLVNALDTSYLIGSPAPLTALALQMFQQVKADGEGLSDHSALVKYYEKLAEMMIEP